MAKLKIKLYNFTEKDVKEITKKNKNKNENKEIDQLQFGVKELEEQLNRIINLARSLEFIEQENGLSPENEGFITYDKHKVLKLKKYLKWVLEIWKNKGWLKHTSIEEETKCLGNSFIKIFNGIEKTLTKNVAYKIHSVLSLRNRAGRTAEHVGNKPTKFDYGIFLEESIAFHDCFFHDSGFYFDAKNIVNYIKQANPGFISKAIMTSLSLLRITLIGYNFKEVFDSALNSIEILILQSCNNISIKNLKALTMLYCISFTLNNESLSERLLNMSIRMAYSLGIDKINIDSESVLISYNDYKQQIELRRLWLLLITNASTSSLLNKPNFITDYSIKELDFTNLSIIEASIANNSFNYQNTCKGIFTAINKNSERMVAIIFEHLQSNIPELNNLNQLSYSQICLPNDKFHQVQTFINGYNIISPTFIYDEAKCQIRNEGIVIERYICKFPKKYKCKFKAIHEIGTSICFNLYQIYLIYPIVLTTPYQLDIPLEKIFILLDVSLKLILIYRAIAYIYFEMILHQMGPHLDLKLDVYKDIKRYLDFRPPPIINKNKEYYFYLMRGCAFMYTSYALVALLQVLSSLEYYNSGLANTEIISLIKTNVIELLEIYKLTYKLKDDFLRMDIDSTIIKIKQVVPRFHILPEYQFDCLMLLKEFDN